MQIAIVGGGPGGLYLASLIKQRFPDDWHVDVYERQPPAESFGWGLIFSDDTLADLELNDPRSHAELERAGRRWRGLEVVNGDASVLVRDNHYSSVARLTLLSILQRRANEVGVNLHYEQNISDLDAFADADLIVGADGFGSQVRRLHQEHFDPQIEMRTHRFLWLGAARGFDTLRFTFRRSDAGVLVGHAYPFGQDISTFIVECDVATWREMEFDECSMDETLRRLGDVFEEDLEGAPLLSNNARWRQFVQLKNQRWSHDGRVVLIGDALHTVHFSIGSGTKLALDDAIVLTGCLERCSSVAEALAEFEGVRRDDVDMYQSMAYRSMLWFEGAKEHVDLAPIELAYQLMTRTGRLDHDSLRQRDPAFLSRYLAAQA